ncbi:Ubiquitin receptor RAD23c [Zea mays]|uniref:Ubiquitin receptor RAD23 n=2 Tax=Zea mays TaxID=4577 RepID=A0A1D6I428_MAIZE|nr:Ubiquitin receptor RAD23c [Zea mays]
MKVSVKTLKGSSFHIEVDPTDKVADVKKVIESIQEQASYPADQQVLIHQGKVLKDDTTLEENQVVENNFLVIMLRQVGYLFIILVDTWAHDKSRVYDLKCSIYLINCNLSQNKGSSSAAPAKVTANQAPSTQTVPATPPQTSAAPDAPAPIVPVSAPAATATASAAPAVAVSTEADSYGQATSNLVAGSNLEGTIKSILEMGGGTWDRDTVLRALRAAYNNPERAVEYLYSVRMILCPRYFLGLTCDELSAIYVCPDTNVLHLLFRGFLNKWRFLHRLRVPNQSTLFRRYNQLKLDQMLTLSTSFPNLFRMIPLMPTQEILMFCVITHSSKTYLVWFRLTLKFCRSPLLQELRKQNPRVMQLIQENQAEFMRLISEPLEGDEENEMMLDQMADATETIAVTPEENEAILRLEGMGFDRALVLEVFFACNKNEQLAANYLLDHMHEFDNDDGLGGPPL